MVQNVPHRRVIKELSLLKNTLSTILFLILNTKRSLNKPLTELFTHISAASYRFGFHSGKLRPGSLYILRGGGGWSKMRDMKTISKMTI